jgi:AraC family transcriptional regulator
MDYSLQLHEALRQACAQRRGLNPRAMSRVLAHIEGNLGESLTLGALADVACMSRFHFARMFRLTTGFSPMAYVLHQRVERARQRLGEGRRRLSDLAAELGFCDQSHFTRIFRRTTGYTPRDYARRFDVRIAQQPCTAAERSSRSAVNDAEFAIHGVSR